ncbi:unnamed protein product, partial [Owenia fusiformis]
PPKWNTIFGTKGIPHVFNYQYCSIFPVPIITLDYNDINQPRNPSTAKPQPTKYTTGKKFECKLCLKSFSAKWNLYIHMNIHNGARPYKCDICEKAFANPGTLNHHRKTHYMGQ